MRGAVIISHLSSVVSFSARTLLGMPGLEFTHLSPGGQGQNSHVTNIHLGKTARQIAAESPPSAIALYDFDKKSGQLYLAVIKTLGLLGTLKSSLTFQGLFHGSAIRASGATSLATSLLPCAVHRPSHCFARRHGGLSRPEIWDKRLLRRRRG